MAEAMRGITKAMWSNEQAAQCKNLKGKMKEWKKLSQMPLTILLMLQPQGDDTPLSRVP
jgi:hypothetical protein